MSNCKQKDCKNKADYRYTWAGQDESFICKEHSHKMKAVASAIGYYVQLIPLKEQQNKEGGDE